MAKVIHPSPAEEAKIKSEKVLRYELMQVGDMLRPIARLQDNYVPLGPKSVKRLRLGIEYKSLRTLIIAGFVEGYQPQPHRWSMNLTSFFAFLDRCKADVDFWKKPENLRRWRDARLNV